MGWEPCWSQNLKGALCSREQNGCCGDKALGDLGGGEVGRAIWEEKSDGKASFMEKHICHIRLGKDNFYLKRASTGHSCGHEAYDVFLLQLLEQLFFIIFSDLSVRLFSCHLYSLEEKHFGVRLQESDYRFEGKSH